MSRRKTPMSLRRQSVTAIVRAVVNGCVKATGEEASSIWKYTAEIPPFFTEEYLKKVLQVLSDLNHTDHLRSALPLQCYELMFFKLKMSTVVKEAVLSNIDALTNLRSMTIDWHYLSNNSVIKNQMWQFPQLVSLELSPDITSETLQMITENCCKLKKLNFSINPLRSLDFLLIGKCVELRDLTIWCPECNPVYDVIYLLDILPQLQSLHVTNGGVNLMEGLLTTLSEVKTCNETYELKSFCNWLPSGDLLPLLCTYFPKIQDLKLVLYYDSSSSLTGFAHLKKLVVRGSSSDSKGVLQPHIKVPPMCFSGLVEFSLEYMDVSIFKEDQEFSLPLLKKLKVLNCSHVDISAIAAKCPNLERLDIQDSSVNSLSASNSSYLPYRYLKSITFGACFSKQHILFVVSFCNGLKTLKISDMCHRNPLTNNCGIDGNLMKSILAQNPMQQLESLLVRSNSLTFMNLTTIMESLPQLHDLLLHIRAEEWSSEIKLWFKRQLQEFHLSECCVILQYF